MWDLDLKPLFWCLFIGGVLCGAVLVGIIIFISRHVH